MRTEQDRVIENIKVPKHVALGKYFMSIANRLFIKARAMMKEKTITVHYVLILNITQVVNDLLIMTYLIK